MMKTPLKEVTILLENIEITEAVTDDATFLKSGIYVRLMVKDTGIGIREEYLTRIFDPFFTTKERSEGTGLGLSSAQVIVQNHDGEIIVDSTPNAGTVFSVFLPVHAKEMVQSIVLPPSEHSDSAPKRRDERILWVDDDPQMMRMGKRTLSQLGYRVTVAESGANALQIFLQNPTSIDLVVTDYNMPVMNGCELAEALRKADGSLPVILVSGLGETVPPEEIKQRGAALFLSKPVPVDLLDRKIRAILDRRENGERVR